jgi:hypothetical protein
MVLFVPLVQRQMAAKNKFMTPKLEALTAHRVLNRPCSGMLAALL